MAVDHFHHHHAGPPAFEHLVNSMVSDVALFGALIMTITAVILAFFRIYLLDAFLLATVYRSVDKKTLTDTQRRSFINHHVAAALKILLIALAGYPLLRILTTGASPHTPYAPGSRATLGDVLMVASQIFTMMYVFELFYREKVSPISFAHHVGAMVIAQAAVAMSINFDDEKDAVPEFLLCFIWGAFDCVAELWPHIAMVLYRTHMTNHSLLHLVFSATVVLEVAGTVIETAVTMWLFGTLWNRWSLSLKIITPILHILFSAAQLWGAYIFRNLAAEQKAKVEDEKRQFEVDG